MLLKFVLSILLLNQALSSNITSFIFNKFNSTDLILYGISDITDRGLLQLTNNTVLQSGLAFYPHPIHFKSKSFHTTFIFAILPEYPDVSNHGMTFLLSSSMEIMATPGPFFGIFNETDKFNSTNLLAIEMDTSKTIGFKDIDNNHIGINVDSVKSVNSSSVAYIDNNNEYKRMSLSSGDSMQVWVDCSGTNIEVRIAPIGASRPKIALVSSQVNLSSVLSDEMYVGFSASTGDVTAFHYVQEWSFSLNDNTEALDIEHIQPIQPIPRQSNPGKRLKPIIIALPHVGVIVLLVLSFGAYFAIKRKRKFAELLEDWKIKYGPHRFTYKDLFNATKGFHEDRLLGVGGFGRVYKGVLRKSNLEIAVKKISHESQQGMKEFVAEIVSMGRLRHRNLVQLLGYCRRQGELLLVYEFMPNSSLDKFLFSDRKATLDWKQRFQIIKGVASAEKQTKTMQRRGAKKKRGVNDILRYLRGTPDHGLVFGGSDRDFSLVGFCNSDYAGDRDRRKSISGYVFVIEGTYISWRTRLQTIVVLSTTEAELITAVEAAKETLYLKRLMCDLGFVFNEVEVNFDNQSAIHLAKNMAFSSRTKHIEVRESFLVAMGEEKLVRLQKVHTEKNAADMFTKSLPIAKFEHCSNLIRLLKC